MEEFQDIVVENQTKYRLRVRFTIYDCFEERVLTPMEKYMLSEEALPAERTIRIIVREDKEE